MEFGVKWKDFPKFILQKGARKKCANCLLTIRIAVIFITSVYIGLKKHEIHTSLVKT
jgi:hypothetical protein